MWDEADWRQLQHNVEGFPHGEAPPPINDIVILDMCLDPASTCVVFCNPALVKSTLGRLGNKEYIKLCGDGTFRLARGGWVLISVGVLTKHYAQGESDKMPAWRTTYHVLSCAMVNKENEANYKFLFRATKRAGFAMANIDLAAATRQYHCDWHSGEEAARRAEFPNSCRCGDWAHFTGATVRPKSTLPTSDESVAVWRSGVFNTI